MLGIFSILTLALVVFSIAGFGIGKVLAVMSSSLKNLSLSLSDGTILSLLFIWTTLQIHVLMLPAKSGFPIYMTLVLTFLGSIGFKSWVARMRSEAKLSRKIFTIKFVSILLFNLLVSWQAARPINWTDTWLYHLNMVKWIRDYGIVTGLAHLHSRLGFNSSFHTFATFFDLGPLNGRSAHLALAFLSSATIMRALSFGFNKSAARIYCSTLSIRGVSIAIAVYIGLMTSVASLSTDHALGFICLLFGLEILLFSVETNRQIISVRLGIALNLAAIASGTKMAALPLVAIMFALTALFIWQQRHRNHDAIWGLPLLILISAPPIANLLTHVAATIKLTGWPFYPIPVFEMGFDYDIPKLLVEAELESVANWARHRSSAPPESFLAWFQPWIMTHLKNSQFLLMTSSLTISTLLTLKSHFHKNDLDPVNMSQIILFSSSCALFLFWLKGAPDIRFALGVYILSILAAQISIHNILGDGQMTQVSVIITIAVLAISTMQDLQNLTLPQAIVRIPVATSMPLKTEVMDGASGQGGFTLYVPLNGLCGNSPLPCTPYPSEKIKLKERGNLASGFTN